MLRCNLLSYLIHGMARWCGLGDIYIYNSIHWLSFCTWYCALTCATPELQLVLLFNFLLQLMLRCSFLCCASMIRPALRFNLRHAITCAMPLCFNFLLHVIWRFTLRNCPWGWAISVVITAHLGLDASEDIGTCRKCWTKYVRRDGLWMFVDHMMPCKGGYASFKGHTKYHLRTQKKKEHISLQKNTVLNKWQGTVAKHNHIAAVMIELLTSWHYDMKECQIIDGWANPAVNQHVGGCVHVCLGISRGPNHTMRAHALEKFWSKRALPLVASLDCLESHQ